MNLLTLMKKRCSVRKYLDKDIPDDVLLEVLEAGRIAPSACNNQPWHFVIVKDPELKAEIANPWAAEAPAVIVICADHKASWKRHDGKDHADIDAAITADHMTLMAVEKGLGTCWICSFDAGKCGKLLKLPEHMEAVILLPIGYPESEKSPDRHDKDRKKLDDIISREQF